METINQTTSTPLTGPASFEGLDTDQLFKWQKQRRKPEGVGGYPITGFGNGKMTLWVPPAEEKTRIVVRNQKVVRETVSAQPIPELDALRERMRRSFGLSPMRTLTVLDDLFFDYTIAALKINYILSDDDLTLLLQGEQWHRDMMVHIWGGQESNARPRPGVRAMIDATRDEPATGSPAATLPTPVTPVSGTLNRTRRRSFISKFFRRS